MVKYLFLAFLMSCATSADYEGRSEIKKTHTRNYQPENSKSYEVEDKRVSLTYVPTIIEPSISINLKNKTNKPIKVIWDETAFINQTGSTEGIHSTGVKIADRSAPKVPTIVLPNSTLMDQIVINSLVEFSSSQYGSGWIYHPICGQKNLYTHELDDKDCSGKTFGIFLTYESEGKRYNLTAKYRYEGSTLIKKQ